MPTNLSDTAMSIHLQNQKNRSNYMYDWNNEIKEDYENKRLYHLAMANHFQALGNGMEDESNLDALEFMTVFRKKE